MKCVSKKNWLLATKSLLFLALIVFGNSAFSPPNENTIQCSAPENLTISGQDSESVSFTWDSPVGSVDYKVWYFREEGNYTSAEITTSNTTITYSNLPAGTYTFYFVSSCQEQSSQAIIVDDLIMG